MLPEHHRNQPDEGQQVTHQPQHDRVDQLPRRLRALRHPHQDVRGIGGAEKGRVLPQELAEDPRLDLRDNPVARLGKHDLLQIGHRPPDQEGQRDGQRHQHHLLPVAGRRDGIEEQLHDPGRGGGRGGDPHHRQNRNRIGQPLAGHILQKHARHRALRPAAAQKPRKEVREGSGQTRHAAGTLQGISAVLPQPGRKGKCPDCRRAGHRPRRIPCICGPTGLYAASTARPVSTPG